MPPSCDAPWLAVKAARPGSLTDTSHLASLHRFAVQGMARHLVLFRARTIVIAKLIVCPMLVILLAAVV